MNMPFFLKKMLVIDLIANDSSIHIFNLRSSNEMIDFSLVINCMPDFLIY